MKLSDPNDTVMILLDHQTGLFQTVKDIPLQDLRGRLRQLPATPTHRMRYRGSTKELAR